MSVVVVRGDARRLPLPDESVDLICTSPPYFALRDYRDGDASLAGQIGSEPTPAAYIAALVECTREWVRVLKPGGSMWVNLGDAYSGKPSSDGTRRRDKAGAADYRGVRGRGVHRPGGPSEWTNSTAAWLAAVLDCEGSVSGRLLKKTGTEGSFVVWMRVGMMDREVVERIYAITGVGRVFQDSRGVWNWHVASQAARYVLERIWPWLVIKQRRALAAIELCRHVEERAARGLRMLTAEDRAYRTAIIEAIRDWNGHPARPNDYDPPRPKPISLPDSATETPAKSLQLLPHRYAIACVDQLGLILRQDQVWAKANGLPESVTDRTRRSHEYWMHLVKQPRYFAAVDEIREAHAPKTLTHRGGGQAYGNDRNPDNNWGNPNGKARIVDPLGKLPGSVWTIATEPLQVPAGIDADHFAAYPTEWPRRLILGWSPSGICTACGEGRRPVVAKDYETIHVQKTRKRSESFTGGAWEPERTPYGVARVSATITGYACACTPYTDHPGTRSTATRDQAHYAKADPVRARPDVAGNELWNYERTGPVREYHFDRWTAAPTRPSVVLDPFSGTGTTTHVAAALGRIGIGVDLSATYCRLASSAELYDRRLRKVLGIVKVPAQIEGQEALWA